MCQTTTCHNMYAGRKWIECRQRNDVNVINEFLFISAIHFKRWKLTGDLRLFLSQIIYHNIITLVSYTYTFVSNKPTSHPPEQSDAYVHIFLLYCMWIEFCIKLLRTKMTALAKIAPIFQSLIEWCQTNARGTKTAKHI